MTKISSLTALTGAGVDTAADLIPIVDMSLAGALRNKKITVAELGIALQAIIDARVAVGVTGLLDFKGSTDCSANPSYPAASKGDYYLVSVAGKIGGASGVVVEAGDAYFATADNAGGTQAAVGTSWAVVQGNIVGGTITELDDIPDVNAPSPTAGDCLAWDDGANEWVASPLPGGGAGGTVPDGGATGDVLGKMSGVDQDVGWLTLPAYSGARVYKASDQTGASFTTATALTWDSEDHDTGGYHVITSTVTITIASPSVVTWAAHGFHAGVPVVFTTTGALPTGLTLGTTYYVVSPIANSFSVAATPGGAAINTSGTQSGVQTATNYSCFKIPAGVDRVDVDYNVRIAAITGDTFFAITMVKNGSSSFREASGCSLETGTTAGSLRCGAISMAVTTGDLIECLALSESDVTVDITALRSSAAIRAAA